MLSHTGEKPFICKQCNYLFVYLHIRHPGTSFLRSSYNYIFRNIAYVIVYVWPSRTWDEILLPFQKGLFFPLGDIRLFLPTRIRICAYAHHPTWIRHGRIRMAIPNSSPLVSAILICARRAFDSKPLTSSTILGTAVSVSRPQMFLESVSPSDSPSIRY